MPFCRISDQIGYRIWLFTKIFGSDRMSDIKIVIFFGSDRISDDFFFQNFRIGLDIGFSSLQNFSVRIGCRIIFLKLFSDRIGYQIIFFFKIFGSDRIGFFRISDKIRMIRNPPKLYSKLPLTDGPLLP